MNKNFFHEFRTIHKNHPKKYLLYKTAKFLFFLRKIIHLLPSKGYIASLQYQLDQLECKGSWIKKDESPEARMITLKKRSLDVSKISHPSQIKAHLFGSWIYDCKGEESLPLWQANYYLVLLLECLLDYNDSVNILNVGFETGLLEFYLGTTYKNSKITGIDIQPVTKEFCEKHYGELLPNNVNFIIGDYGVFIKDFCPNIVTSSQTICCLNAKELNSIIDTSKKKGVKTILCAEPFTMSDYGNYPSFGKGRRSEPCNGGSFYNHDYLSYFKYHGYKCDYASWFPNPFYGRLDHHLFVGCFSL